MSGKDQDSFVPVSRITAELTLPSRSVRRTRQRPAKEIIISLWLMILLANPDSTTTDGILDDSFFALKTDKIVVLMICDCTSFYLNSISLTPSGKDRSRST